MCAELRRKPTLPNLAAAVTLYHMAIEATLAQPGQHFIMSYLEERDLMPGFRAGMENVAQDEQRHIGFGVKLLADLCREDPECGTRLPTAARRDPFHGCRAGAAGWDRRYTESSAYPRGHRRRGAASLETKLRQRGPPDG